MLGEEKALLAQLSQAGYKVSWKTSQICQQEIEYLGFAISEGQRALGPVRKWVVCSIPQPKTKKDVLEFLGAVGFCYIWIPEYSSLAKPLYEAIAGSRKDPLNWGPNQEKAFQEIKRLLTSAPELGLPDVKRPFNLFICKKNHTALGVLKHWDHGSGQWLTCRKA
jgi:hypothetical protein